MGEIIKKIASLKEVFFIKICLKTIANMQIKFV
jgi:hypothetical protein